MSRFSRVVDFSATASGSEIPAAAKPAPKKAVAPVVTKPSAPVAPGTAQGKYANAVPVNVRRDAVETAVVVKAAPAAKPAPSAPRRAIGYSMNPMDAKAAAAGVLTIECGGQKRGEDGKLRPCGCKGDHRTMVAPSAEDMKRLYHANPRPEDVLRESRCRASSKVDGRQVRYFPMAQVMDRVADAAEQYDRSLEDGRIGRLMAKVRSAPAAKPAAKTAASKTA